MAACKCIEVDVSRQLVSAGRPASWEVNDEIQIDERKIRWLTKPRRAAPRRVGTTKQRRMQRCAIFDATRSVHGTSITITITIIRISSSSSSSNSSWIIYLSPVVVRSSRMLSLHPILHEQEKNNTELDIYLRSNLSGFMPYIVLTCCNSGCKS